MIITVAVVARLPQQDTDVSKVIAFLQHCVLVHGIAIHDVHAARKNHVDVLRHLTSPLHHRQLLILQPLALLVLLLRLLSEVVEL